MFIVIYATAACIACRIRYAFYSSHAPIRSCSCATRPSGSDKHPHELAACSSRRSFCECPNILCHSLQPKYHPNNTEKNRSGRYDEQKHCWTTYINWQVMKSVYVEHAIFKNSTADGFLRPRLCGGLQKSPSSGCCTPPDRYHILFLPDD